MFTYLPLAVGGRVPEGYRLIVAYAKEDTGDVVVPIDIDPDKLPEKLHNCDWEGCCTFSHVVRFSISHKYETEARLQAAELCAAQPADLAGLLVDLLVSRGYVNESDRVRCRKFLAGAMPSEGNRERMLKEVYRCLSDSLMEMRDRPQVAMNWIGSMMVDIMRYLAARGVEVPVGGKDRKESCRESYALVHRATPERTWFIVDRESCEEMKAKTLTKVKVVPE